MDNLITICIFMGLGVVAVFSAVVFGKAARPDLPNLEKKLTYECGELPIGNSWVQFDLRFYIVALVFLVFDVEVALFYPWATVFQQFKLAALIDMLVFFVVLGVGYVYLWRFGYLEWVRSHVAIGRQVAVGAQDKAALVAAARKDPETIEV